MHKKLFLFILLSGYTTTNFDLWILKGLHDVFVLVINLLGVDWEFKHITIRLFEASGTIG